MAEVGDRAEQAHRLALYGYAITLGLAEGPAQIACVLVIVSAIWSGRARWKWSLFEGGVLTWWVAGAIGLLLSGLRPSSGDWSRPSMALAALVGAWSIDRRDEKLVGELAWCFGIAIAINGAYGLLQLGFGPFAWDGLFLKNPASGQIWIPGRVTHELAASGLYYNRLKLAHVGIAGLAMMVLIASSRTAGTRARRAAAIGLALLGGGVLYTYARMAFVALLAAMGSLGAFGKRARFIWATIGCGALALGVLLLTPYGRARFDTLSEDGALRLGLFRAGLRLYGQHLWFGVGHGAYSLVVGPFLPSGASGVHSTSPHNLWIQVLAETGAIGGLGFVAAQWAAFSAAAKRLRSSVEAGPSAIYARWVWVVLLGLSITGLSHSTLHHGPVALLYWTVCGAAIAEGRARGDREER